MAAAKERLGQLHHEAISNVQIFGEAAQPLIWLADFIVTRKH